MIVKRESDIVTSLIMMMVLLIGLNSFVFLVKGRMKSSLLRWSQIMRRLMLWPDASLFKKIEILSVYYSFNLKFECGDLF